MTPSPIPLDPTPESSMGPGRGAGLSTPRPNPLNPDLLKIKMRLVCNHSMTPRQTDILDTDISNFLKWCGHLNLANTVIASRIHKHVAAGGDIIPNPPPRRRLA